MQLSGLVSRYETLRGIDTLSGGGNSAKSICFSSEKASILEGKNSLTSYVK